MTEGITVAVKKVAIPRGGDVHCCLPQCWSPASGKRRDASGGRMHDRHAHCSPSYHRRMGHQMGTDGQVSGRRGSLLSGDGRHCPGSESAGCCALYLAPVPRTWNAQSNEEQEFCWETNAGVNITRPRISGDITHQRLQDSGEGPWTLHQSTRGSIYMYLKTIATSGPWGRCPGAVLDPDTP